MNGRCRAVRARQRRVPPKSALGKRGGLTEHTMELVEVMWGLEQQKPDVMAESMD